MTAIVKETDARGPLNNGRHPAGESLWLVVRGDSRSWVVRQFGRDHSIGSIKKFTLANARDEAEKILAQVQKGLDPTAEKHKAKQAQERRKTFAQVAELVIAKKIDAWKVSELKGEKATLGNWKHDLEVVCAPLAKMPIDEIVLADVIEIVMPIFDAKKDDTARALLNRLERVFNYAYVAGWRTTANPATISIWKELAPERAKPEVDPHHKSVEWQDGPAALAKIRAGLGISAQLAEFCILTCVRSQEARGARWDEIDLVKRVWTVPASRMKMSRVHEVPLSDAAIELLGRIERTGDFVFVGGRGELAQAEGDAMSHQGLWAFVNRATGSSVHGFRSTFKNWADNHGVLDRLSEKCLAHKDKNKVRGAYATDQLTEVRRPIMQAWAVFLSGAVAPDNVIPLRSAA